MRAVVQRVLKGQVTVEEEVIGSVNQGLVVLIGFQSTDDEKTIQYMIDKIFNLRIFEDQEGKMNRSLVDIQGGLLIVPNFTLYGDCRKGRRPSFTSAAPPQQAEVLFQKYIEKAYEVGEEKGVFIQEGQFQADMKVELVNDGPITLIIDSDKIL
ncbi:MAG: D-tyrosyl-tRNA(Tyr) deacylase [Epulopiscium sp.]|nr:D-tyrosyl-tRNA(Tyr) deacylase [Candidatus Epulonipiscium sp.]